MYTIKNGSLKGYAICETCGSVLDIYLDFHQCLLQPEIVQVHMNYSKIYPSVHFICAAFPMTL